MAVQLRRGRPLTPCSGLWSSQVRQPHAPLQNLALRSHLAADIDPARFGAAFASVVAASDASADRIVDEGAGPVVVLSDEAAPTAVVDVALADAATGPESRASSPVNMAVHAHDSVLLRHEDRTWSWYLALHHTVTDAASRALVFEATADCLRRRRRAEFASYYDWARSLDQADAPPKVAKARAFWRRPSASAPRPAQLYQPVRRPTSDSVRIPVSLGGLENPIADAMAGSYRMLSEDLAWTVLLATSTAIHVHRLSGATEFAIGLPVHNRTDATSRSLVGPLMELYPVDVAIEPDDTHRSLHKRIGRAVTTTLRNATPGSAPTQPDFDAIVNVIPRAGLGSFAGIETTTTWVDTDAADPSNLLRVQLTTYGGAPELSLDANAGAVGATHCTRIAEHHRTILADIITTPDGAIAGPTIVTDHERELLDRWGTGAERASDPPLVVDALRASLAGSDHVALRDGDQRLTGDELWRRAQAAAGALAASGVGPGHRVGIEMPRSAEAVTAILAVLLAGGSYVPLDPAQPAERLRRLAERAGCDRVLRPGDLDALVAGARDVADGAASAVDEAYLLFTSGSSGRPKGVPITHRGLADYIAFARDAYLDPGERPVAPLFGALTFDLTVTSLFLPLVTGGCIVVIAADGPAGLAEIARHRELTWMKATPSHLRVLTRDLPDDHGLRTLVVGGEAFGTPLATALWATSGGSGDLQRVRADRSRRRVHGPSWRSRYTPDPMCPSGCPAPGVELRIVDATLAPVPIGAVGELLISHRGLTAGYLDRDDDQDRFVEFDGRRWYRSGDLVRLADDDTCVYLGRADEQLKVGGIRLDPTEVEAGIADHPAIESVAVRLWSPHAPDDVRHCVRCGLASSVPGIGFDDAGVCSTCRAYARVADAARLLRNTRRPRRRPRRGPPHPHR